jgi:hypothetical protein
MDQFVLGRDDDDLKVVCTSRSEDGRAENLRVTLKRAGITAELDVFVGDYQDHWLDRWAESIEADWRGWDGERRYRSISNELVLVARHSGHVVIDITLSSWSQDWTVTSSVAVEPGEELTRLVTAIRETISGHS